MRTQLPVLQTTSPARLSEKPRGCPPRRAFACSYDISLSLSLYIYIYIYIFMYYKHIHTHMYMIVYTNLHAENLESKGLDSGESSSLLWTFPWTCECIRPVHLLRVFLLRVQPIWVKPSEIQTLNRRTGRTTLHYLHAEWEVCVCTHACRQSLFPSERRLRFCARKPGPFQQTSGTHKWWFMKLWFSRGSKMHTSNTKFTRTRRKHGRAIHRAIRQPARGDTRRGNQSHAFLAFRRSA